MHALRNTKIAWIAGWLLLFMAFTWGSLVFAEGKTVVLVNVAEGIGVSTVSSIQKGLDRAEEINAVCCVIKLDTPGGYLESTRQIVKAMLKSEVPVVVYVAPSGARAASAGMLITIAADVAAMAPATNIGAAHPVGPFGIEIGDTIGDKLVNDMVANAKSVAEKQGRNAEWVEKAIRESISSTEKEALEQNVIDYIAKDLPELLAEMNGREIPGKGVLETEGCTIEPFKDGFREKLLRIIAGPNISFILLIAGIIGLYIEFTSPGVILPGVFGAISLFLGLYAIQTLPVNYTGVVLILLSGVFFVLETQIASHGALAIGGGISMFLGATMLFDYEVSGMRVAWSVLIPAVVVVSAFFLIVAALVVKAHRAKVRTGESGLVGETGRVTLASSNSKGKVLVHAETWNAKFEHPVEVGDYIQVESVDGLVLTVKKIPAP